MSTNLVYTIWTVFGGFILHFLLSNFLTVLLKPSYEPFVDTAAELISRKITLLLPPNEKIYKEIFANSPDPIYQELSRTLYICNSYRQYYRLSRFIYMMSWGDGRFIRPTNIALMRVQPKDNRKSALHYSKEYVKGRNHFLGSIANKKWPLKKVFLNLFMIKH